eukprot:scaffold92320_cov60-Phaeocystis_antarctica.AAC.5
MSWARHASVSVPISDSSGAARPKMAACAWSSRAAQPHWPLARACSMHVRRSSPPTSHPLPPSLSSGMARRHPGAAPAARSCNTRVGAPSVHAAASAAPSSFEEGTNENGIGSRGRELKLAASQLARTHTECALALALALALGRCACSASLGRVPSPLLVIGLKVGAVPRLRRGSVPPWWWACQARAAPALTPPPGKSPCAGT